MLNLRKVGDNSHVPAVWFAAEPEDKRSNIRFVFYQEGIDIMNFIISRQLYMLRNLNFIKSGNIITVFIKGNRTFFCIH